MTRTFSLILCALLSACGGGGGGEGGNDQVPTTVVQPAPAPGPLDPSLWDIRFSSGTPDHPAAVPNGFEIDVPQAGMGSLHYVDRPIGPLTGRHKVVMCYRIDYEQGTAIVPLSDMSAPSMLTLYFQRQGDGMTARDEAFRWYASFASQMPITAGEHTVEAALDANWTAVLTSSRENNRAGFDAALAHTARVGFVLGGGTGLGHGVYATGPARLVVTSFKVE